MQCFHDTFSTILKSHPWHDLTPTHKSLPSLSKAIKFISILRPRPRWNFCIKLVQASYFTCEEIAQRDDSPGQWPCPALFSWDYRVSPCWREVANTKQEFGTGTLLVVFLVSTWTCSQQAIQQAGYLFHDFPGSFMLYHWAQNGLNRNSPSDLGKPFDLLKVLFIFPSTNKRKKHLSKKETWVLI